MFTLSSHLIILPAFWCAYYKFARKISKKGGKKPWFNTRRIQNKSAQFHAKSIIEFPHSIFLMMRGLKEEKKIMHLEVVQLDLSLEAKISHFSLLIAVTLWLKILG